MSKETENKKGISRRSFLKGMGTGAIGVAAASTGVFAAGCSQKSSLVDGENAAAGIPDMMNKLGYQCSEDWLGEAPQIADSDIVRTIETEVVVCGGGHAGSQCALAAAQKGAKVALLEVQSKDTYAAHAVDICAYNSKLLSDRGFGGYNTGDIVAEFVRRGAGRVNADIIRSFVEESGEMLDNIVSITPETSNMFDFDSGQCQVQIAYGKPDSSYYPIERSGFKGWASCLQTMGTHNSNPIDGRDPKDVMRMTEMEIYTRLAAEKLGATWHWNTTATVLVQNDNGDVTGVIAKGPDGYIRFNASKAVCLCTGDFSSNADMVWNLLDDVNELGARNGMTRKEMTGQGGNGHGIKMGCWAGGIIESHPRPSMDTMMYTPGPWGDAPFPMVNSKGMRFMDEGMCGLHAPMMLRQPHGPIALVTDSDFLESLKECSIDHGAADWGDAYVNIHHYWDRMQNDMKAALTAGAEGAEVHDVAVPYREWRIFTVYAGQTLDELFGYLGYKGAVKAQALATIEEYNKMCENGVDTLYGKDSAFMKPVVKGPFYGAVVMNECKNRAGLVTLAGLVTDEYMNVLKSDYSTPIKGLYASGNCLGHRYGPGYSTPTAGASMGMALTHGRVLGKHVAVL